MSYAISHWCTADHQPEEPRYNIKHRRNGILERQKKYLKASSNTFILQTITATENKCAALSGRGWMEYKVSRGIYRRGQFDGVFSHGAFCRVLCRGSRWRLCRWESRASASGRSRGEAAASSCLLMSQTHQGTLYHSAEGDKWTRKGDTNQVRGSVIGSLFSAPL